MKSKPFVKWAGGKGRLVSKIVAKLPDNIGTYYEPFIGGGAVFFGLANRRGFHRAVVGDKCPELMNTYQVVRDNVDALIHVLSQPQFKYEKEAYLKIRSENPDKLNPTARAARMLYLNHTCFNGLYRVNRKGQFNTPFGKYKNPIICDEANLRACSDALKPVELAEADFEDICTDAGPGDVVYYDPPYMPTSKTSSFTGYTPGGFTFDDHLRLSELFKKLDDRGVVQVLSNSSNSDVTTLFNGFNLEVMTNACSMADPDRRKSVPEILVDNNLKP